jgi:hypothetical protein
MLTTFLIDLPGVLSPETPETDLGVGRAPVGAGNDGGGNAADGARRPVLGVFGVDLLAGVGRPPVLFRVLPTGSAGRAAVGGPLDGREGRGSEADMIRPCLSGDRTRRTCATERIRVEDRVTDDA